MDVKQLDRTNRPQLLPDKTGGNERIPDTERARISFTPREEYHVARKGWDEGGPRR